MNPYLELVETAVRATSFVRGTAYSWFGEVSEPILPAKLKKVAAAAAREYLLSGLQSELYESFYCKGFAAPTDRESHRGPSKGIGPFIDGLSTANAGEGYWDFGWEIVSAAQGEVSLSRAGLELRAKIEHCQIPNGTLIEPGAQLSLRLPKELLSISPGFYMAVSNCSLNQDASQTLVRLYWNLTPEGAVPFVRIATLALNQASLPFRLKVVNDPGRFNRCDAGVIYILRNDYDRAKHILEGIYGELAAHLKYAIPAFSKRLAPGLGVAEDVGHAAVSFGMHRTRVLADGMLRAYEKGKTELQDRVRAVEEHFAEEGISLEAPFLNSGSSDGYQFQVPPSTNTPREARLASRTESGTEAFLKTSYEIGRSLTRDAFWHEDACNWLGAEPGEQNIRGKTGITYKTLGPDLYGGTAGVALFLTDLSAATGDPEFRRTAFGALRHATTQLDAVPPTNRFALYTGWMGIAFAAAHAGVVLKADEWVSLSQQLVQRCVSENNGPQGFDLLSGTAGTIVALIKLGEMLHDPTLLDFALRWGDGLLASAGKDRGGYSWKSPGFANQRNLTGFSHGVAGIGYAFIELFRASAEPRFRAAAEMAFGYERYWFDAEANNWPDFRKSPDSRQRGKRPARFATYWCHGAPGIALSRLRAFEVLRDERCKEEARAALQTTGEMVEATLASNTGNFSLCHGLTGNCEVLRYGRIVLGQDLASYDSLTLKVATAGIDMYGRPAKPWPCGAGGGETPSIMLGLAGIGYFYLRCHGAATAPLLLL